MDEIIGLNIGGHIYTTSRSTLTRYPDSMLGIMFSDRLPSAKDAHGNFVIDRDGKVFRHILNFLRTSELVLPDSYKEFDMLAKEADYYQIQELISAISDSDPVTARGSKRVVRLEIREYEQRYSEDVRVMGMGRMQYLSKKRDTYFGVFTDWSIYSSYDALLLLNQSGKGKDLYNDKTDIPQGVIYEIGDLPQYGNLLRINWYNKLKMIHAHAIEVGNFKIATPANLPLVPHPAGTRISAKDVTSHIFTQLHSLGYRLESVSDTVDSVQDIDPQLSLVKLHSAKTCIFTQY